METATRRPTFHVSFILNGRRESYNAEALTIAEMVRAAITYLNVTADSSFEDFEADMNEANEFATFCVSETLDDSGEWCDPRQSFADLWQRFLAAVPAHSSGPIERVGNHRKPPHLRARTSKSRARK